MSMLPLVSKMSYDGNLGQQMWVLAQQCFVPQKRPFQGQVSAHGDSRGGPLPLLCGEQKMSSQLVKEIPYRF